MEYNLFMRKEREARKGTGFMNLLFLVVVVWLGYGAYQQGYLDNLLGTLEGGHTFTSIEGTTCDDLKESAIGQELTNSVTDEVTEVMGVRNIKEIKRNNEELVCRGEVLAKGMYETITITLSDWDGELFVEWEVSW
jgi:hypothetical protein|tara:strand:- start:2713 stop:3120 length:408 start_codon:yes stop_codon:yes gene_type:complete